MAPDRAYLVCATQRSGSTLLCSLLTATGVAGRPREYFEAVAATGRPPHPGDYLDGLEPVGNDPRDDPRPPVAPDYSALDGVADYREHLRRTLAAGTTDNGVFAAKLMFNQLAELATLTGALSEHAGVAVSDLPARLTGVDPARVSWVWVSREDVVRQAVSLWTAMQTRPSGRLAARPGGRLAALLRPGGARTAASRLRARPRRSPRERGGARAGLDRRAGARGGRRRATAAPAVR